MEAATHKCFIQVAKSPEEQKEEKKKKNKKKAKRGASAGLATLEANGAGIGTEEDKMSKCQMFVYSGHALSYTELVYRHATQTAETNNSN